MNELRFFNPYADIQHSENLLPHWQQAGAVYFTTFRLADAIPAKLRNQWRDEREIWLQLHPQPWTAEIEQEYHKRFSAAIERWLDAGYGACILRRADCATIVDQTL
jgi:putative transposase